MYVGGECLRGRFPAETQTPRFVPQPFGSDAGKLAALREQLALLGLSLGGGDKPMPKHYAELADKIADRPDRELIQTMLLRSMQQAVYEAQNQGHFRPGIRTLRPLYLAHPPLSRFDGAPRD